MLLQFFIKKLLSRGPMLGNCKLVSVPPCKKVKEKKNPSLPKKQKGNALLRKQKKKYFHT